MELEIITPSDMFFSLEECLRDRTYAPEDLDRMYEDMGMMWRYMTDEERGAAIRQAMERVNAIRLKAKSVSWLR